MTTDYEIVILRDEDGSVNRISENQVELQDVFGNVIGVFSDAEARAHIRAEVEEGKALGRKITVSGAF